MKVKDVMVRDVVSIDASKTLEEAAQLMSEANVGVLPVLEHGRLTGVVTDRDIVVRGVARKADPGATKVGDCASKDTVCARPEWDIDSAMDRMAQEQIGRLPVVDDANQVVGMVTLSSLALRSRQKGDALETAQEVSRRSARA